MPRVITNLNSHKGFSIEEFNKICNKILINMEVGGLGDVFIHRMIFEDIKLLMPNSNITFACPKKYHQAIEDHPFVDKIEDSETVSANEFLIHYQTGRVCTDYEIKISPFSDLHRSDIIAKHIGLELTKHKMHINLNKKYIEQANERLNTNKIKFAICPVSGISSKNITVQQIKLIKEKIDSLGGYLYCIHNEFVPEIANLGITIWNDLSIKQWMGALSAADYVISVDTAAFHYCGGINKRLLGVFSFTDGKVYGKYYDFVLVQKHRDNGDWNCGPCYKWTSCSKTNENLKPCISEITDKMILEGIDSLVKKI
jgi:hypothetical protein